jgi:hypothetical protein
MSHCCNLLKQQLYRIGEKGDLANEIAKAIAK